MVEPVEIPATPEQLRLEKKEIVGVCLLFLIFRWMMLFWFQPAYSEFAQYLYPFMLLSDPGYVGQYGLQPALPFIDYWLEYPPVFPWIALGIYRINMGIFGTGGGGPTAFADAVSMFLSAVDLANMLLIYMIAKKVLNHRFAMRCTVGYALLFFPLVVSTCYFDSLVLCSMLLSLWAMINGKAALAGGAVGFGIMTKFIPGVMALVALKYLAKKPEPGDPYKKDWGRLVHYFGAMVLTMGVLASTFLIVRPDLLEMPLRVTLARPGWETFRAIVEGNYDVGHIGPSDTHLTSDDYCASISSPYMAAVRGQKLDNVREPIRELFRLRIASRFTDNCDYIPPPQDSLKWPLLIVIGAIYLIAVLFSPVEPSPLNYAAVTCITVATGFVYSSGWSPQFIIYMLPLIMLSLWPRVNLFFAVALSVVNFMEMPLWLFYVQTPADPGKEFLAVVIVLRTVLLCIVSALAFYNMSLQAKKPEMNY